MEGSPNRRMQVIKNKKLYTESAADWRWNPVRGFFFVNRMIAPILTKKYEKRFQRLTIKESL